MADNRSSVCAHTAFECDCDCACDGQWENPGFDCLWTDCQCGCSDTCKGCEAAREYMERTDG